MTRRVSAIRATEIEAVYRGRIGPLTRVARAITGDGETARDVVQEAFASAISDRAGYRPTGSLEAWIWRIVVNRAISERRRLTRATRLASIGRGPERSLNADGDESAARLVGALAQLPERQRVAVFLRYYADLDYETIAAVLGISSGTVGASLHAARETLRAELAIEEAHR
jgi:RNA polymerase sigma-70 factor (ECF subfamily)